MGDAGKAAYQGELPPRARRIQSKNDRHILMDRTTSACAENTLNELGLL